MIMTKDEIVNILTDIFAGQNQEFHLPVVINARLTRTLGRVFSQWRGGRYVPTRIEFSKQMLETCDRESVEAVIKHEAAHALVTLETGEDHGHDAVFKAMCARVGTTNDGTTTAVNRTVADKAIFKYTGRCKCCGAIVGQWHRAGQIVKHPDWYHCKCGGDIEITQNW